MGMDAQNGLNHRIRFISNNIKIDKKIKNIVIDFHISTPLIYKNLKYKRIENKIALTFEIWAEYENNICRRYEFPTEVLESLETFENPQIKANKYKYTYDNILILCNYLLNKNFNNIILLDCNYIKNFSYNNFESDNFIFNELCYNNAAELEKYAQNKIMQDLKPFCKYHDNTSYRFNGEIFEIIIHYNCYNDIILIDNIENLDAAKKQVDEIKRPDEKIKQALLYNGLNTNKLY